MNPQTGEIAYKKVTNTHTNRFDSVGVVKLRDETDGSETHLSVTATHPFHHSEKGWVHASLLKVGDKLTEDDGGTLTVTEVTFNPDAPINLTYNLEVADFHTYFVGEDGVLVHNGKGGRFVGNVILSLRIMLGDISVGELDSNVGRSPITKLFQRRKTKKCDVSLEPEELEDPTDVFIRILKELL